MALDYDRAVILDPGEDELESGDEEILFDRTGLLNGRVARRRTPKVPGLRKASGAIPWSSKFNKIVRTFALCSAFFVLGLCIAVPGPTLLDLQKQVDASVTQITTIFTARSSGYLVGSLFGGVLFDRFDQRLLLFASLTWTAIAVGATPWCHAFGTLMAAMALMGAGMGFLDTGGNVMCLELWGDQSGPYIQALHFSFGLGAFVAPLLAEPFLAQRLTTEWNETTPEFAAFSLPESFEQMRDTSPSRRKRADDLGGINTTSISEIKVELNISESMADKVRGGDERSVEVSVPVSVSPKPDSVTTATPVQVKGTEISAHGDSERVSSANASYSAGLVGASQNVLEANPVITDSQLSLAVGQSVKPVPEVKAVHNLVSSDNSPSPSISSADENAAQSSLGSVNSTTVINSVQQSASTPLDLPAIVPNEGSVSTSLPDSNEIPQNATSVDPASPQNGSLVGAEKSSGNGSMLIFAEGEAGNEAVPVTTAVAPTVTDEPTTKRTPKPKPSVNDGENLDNSMDWNKVKLPNPTPEAIVPTTQIVTNPTENLTAVTQTTVVIDNGTTVVPDVNGNTTNDINGINGTEPVGVVDNGHLTVETNGTERLPGPDTENVTVTDSGDNGDDSVLSPSVNGTDLMSSTSNGVTVPPKIEPGPGNGNNTIDKSSDVSIGSITEQPSTATATVSSFVSDGAQYGAYNSSTTAIGNRNTSEVTQREETSVTGGPSAATKEMYLSSLEDTVTKQSAELSSSEESVHDKSIPSVGSVEESSSRPSEPGFTLLTTKTSDDGIIAPYDKHPGEISNPDSSEVENNSGENEGYGSSEEEQQPTVVGRPRVKEESQWSTETSSVTSDLLSSIPAKVETSTMPGKRVHYSKPENTFGSSSDDPPYPLDEIAKKIEQYGVTKIHIVYVIIAVLIFHVALMFLCFVCSKPGRELRPQDSEQKPVQTGDRVFLFILVGLLALLFFLYVGMEVAYGQLVMTFSVNSDLKLSKSTGSFITATFWGSFAAMRFISIFLARIMKPTAMMILDFVLVSIGCVVLSVAASYSEPALWSGSAFVGAGMASIFPTGFSWAEQHVAVTNKIASIFVVGAAAGEMVCPLVVGLVMENFPVALMHQLTATNILCIITFTAAWWLVTRRKRRVAATAMYHIAEQNDEDELVDFPQLTRRIRANT